MKSIKLSTGNWVFIPIPENVTDVGFRFDMLSCNCPDINNRKWLREADEYLAKLGGSFIVEATTDDISENIISEIVEPHRNGFCYYENGGALSGYYCDNAFYSFRSLLKAFDISGRHAILQQLTQPH